MPQFDFGKYNPDSLLKAGSTTRGAASQAEIDPKSILHHINLNFPLPRVPRAFYATQIAIGGLGPLESKKTNTSHVQARAEDSITSESDKDLKRTQLLSGMSTVLATTSFAMLQTITVISAFSNRWAIATAAFTAGLAMGGVAIHTWAKCKEAWKSRFSHLSRVTVHESGIESSNALLSDLRSHPLYPLRKIAKWSTLKASELRRLLLPKKEDGLIYKGSDDLLSKHKRAAITFTAAVISNYIGILSYFYSQSTSMTALSLMLTTVAASCYLIGRNLAEAKICYAARGIRSKLLTNEFLKEKRKIQDATGEQSLLDDDDTFSGSIENGLN